MLTQNIQPLITIIVAVLNREKTIERCLDSINSQTYNHRELIVIDGASTDGTVEIIKSRAEDIAYWHSRPDAGIYDAWNQGLEKAKGDYICFLGSDDAFYDEDSLSMLVGQIQPDDDLVSGMVLLLDSSGKAFRCWGEPWNWSRMKKYMTVAQPAMLHNRKLFDRFGKFDPSYKVAGDYEFLLRLGSSVQHSFVLKPVVLMSNNGISKRRAILAFKENLKIHTLHNEIKLLRAYINFTIAVLKMIPRQLLRR